MVRGFRYVVFEGDSQGLVDLIRGGRKNILMDNLVQDIHHWMAHFEKVEIVQIRRKGNAIDDKLAHVGRSQYNFCCIYDFPPICIFHFL